jgi:hypothetical protein
MALKGDITIYWQEEHPTKKKFTTIKYPDADKMDPEDPNFEKAGTEEEIAEPVFIGMEKEFKDVYVVIRTYALMKVESPMNLYDRDGEFVEAILNKQWNFNLRYTVYESAEAKRQNPENYILENFTEHLLSDEQLDLTALGYSKLKQVKGFEKLIDVI